MPVARAPKTGCETHQVVIACTPAISRAARVSLAAGLITASRAARESGELSAARGADPYRRAGQVRRYAVWPAGVAAVRMAYEVSTFREAHDRRRPVSQPGRGRAR